MERANIGLSIADLMKSVEYELTNVNIRQ